MDLHTTLMTIIAVCAVFSFLFIGFNALLNAKLAPLRENQDRLSARLDSLESKMDQLLNKA